MRFSKKLFIVLVLAAIVPAIIFRIIEWRNGLFNTTGDFFESLFFNSLYSVAVTLSIAWVILAVLHWLNKKFPWSDNVLKRLLLEVGLTFPVALLLGYLWGNILFYINTYHTQSYSDFVFSFLIISVIMNFVLVAISDWFYFFERWKHSLVENEKTKTKNALLEKENLKAQFDSLRNQMNPHFLFNSLNVMSSLVHDSPEKAEAFIDEFADFYRAILEQNDLDLVSLEQEIETCKSYMFLQQIRFEDAVSSTFEVNEALKKTYYCFPFSVQTLLENALKHNRATKEEPLNIKVSFLDGQLKIENTLQPKAQHVISTGKGHQNLTKRYQHFNLIPTFMKTETTYEAILPLLNDSHKSQFIS